MAILTALMVSPLSNLYMGSQSCTQIFNLIIYQIDDIRTAIIETITQFI
jgi:hypothetical protein